MKKNLPVPSVLDKVAGFISPAWGTSRYQARLKFEALKSFSIKSKSGSNTGTLGNWIPSWLNRWSEGRHREKAGGRARELTANDPHAASVIDSMAVNIVGTGLMPQSRPNIKALGWSEEQGETFQEQVEWAFHLWSKKADARGRLPFWALQYRSMLSMLINGEFAQLPLMLPDPDREFSLALQSIDPMRIATPADLSTDQAIRDGVVLNDLGGPSAYWIANPPAHQVITGSYTSLSSRHFARIQARIGHRPGLLHCFMDKDEEQVRGRSVLAPAMKFFRDLSDYLDYELVGAIVASSTPLWIETQDPNGLAEQFKYDEEDAPEKSRYQELTPGQIFYGNANERPHILSSNRPGDTFEAFVERVLRAVGASVGMPYEIISKDFSKVNYSSARAALLEAWRLFKVYQKWLVDCYCGPVWDMVIEEAFLRGYLDIPMSTNDFYAFFPALSRARWIPPKRGHVDPLKEMNSNIKGLDNDILTLADIVAEDGGDWEAVLEQRFREKKKQVL